MKILIINWLLHKIIDYYQLIHYKYWLLIDRLIELSIINWLVNKTTIIIN